MAIFVCARMRPDGVQGLITNPNTGMLHASWYYPGMTARDINPGVAVKTSNDNCPEEIVALNRHHRALVALNPARAQALKTNFDAALDYVTSQDALDGLIDRFTEDYRLAVASARA